MARRLMFLPLIWLGFGMAFTRYINYLIQSYALKITEIAFLFIHSFTIIYLGPMAFMAGTMPGLILISIMIPWLTVALYINTKGLRATSWPSMQVCLMHFRLLKMYSMALLIGPLLKTFL